MDLPDHVIFIIVLKLSLRDVVNFKAVCKQCLHFLDGLDRIVIASDMANKGFNKEYRFLRHYRHLRTKLALPVCYDILFSKNSSGMENWISVVIHNGATSLTVRPICALAWC